MMPEAILESLRPLALRADPYELTIEEVRLVDEHWHVVVRLIVWDRAEPPAVRDIKEQELRAPAPLFDDLERLHAFALGHAEALRQAFASLEREVEYLMPHDLIHFAVLELVKPRLPEDFTRALLTKKRLGGLGRD